MIVVVVIMKRLVFAYFLFTAMMEAVKVGWVERRRGSEQQPYRQTKTERLLSIQKVTPELQASLCASQNHTTNYITTWCRYAE